MGSSIRTVLLTICPASVKTATASPILFVSTCWSDADAPALPNQLSLFVPKAFPPVNIFVKAGESPTLGSLCSGLPTRTKVSLPICVRKSSSSGVRSAAIVLVQIAARLNRMVSRYFTAPCSQCLMCGLWLLLATLPAMSKLLRFLMDKASSIASRCSIIRSRCG